MIVITKLSDSSYAVSNGIVLDAPITKTEVIATCTWKYKLHPEILKDALYFCDKFTDNDMIVFHNNVEYSFKKIDYSEMNNE